MKECMLTTKDNPFNPFTEPEQWYAFDVSKGYYSRELLARIAHTSMDMNDEDYNLVVSKAIDDICRLDLENKFSKIYKD